MFVPSSPRARGLVAGVLAGVIVAGGVTSAEGQGPLAVAAKTKHADAKQDKKLVRSMAGTLTVKRATSAGTADNASKLSGLSASSFLAAGALQSSGIRSETAAPGATTITLLTRGSVTFTADCTLITGSTFRIDVNVTSTESGAFSGGTTGQTALSSTPKSLYNVVGNGAVFRGGEAASIVTPTEAFHAFVTLGVHVGAHDCVAGVVAMI